MIHWRHNALVLAIAAALVLPSAAVASHNSLGGSWHVIQPDEVNTENGTLTPDIEDDPYNLTYHNNLAEPRLDPKDQTGDRYTDCDKAGDADSDDPYEPSKDSTDCYVGYIDLQFEYVTLNTLASPSDEDDDLYFVNPTAEDSFCNGAAPHDDNPEQTGEVFVDQLVASANRSAQHPDCQGDNHEVYETGALYVDTDLMEAGGEALGESLPGDLRTDPGSGILSLPHLYTPYVYLFGQPHENNTDPSPCRAGQGPFGPSPSDPAQADCDIGGSTIGDLGNACGDRTEECRLLEPEDVIAYDDNNDNLVGEASGLGDKARVCLFAPEELTVNPTQARVNVCGLFAIRMGDFLDANTAGGLDSEAVPDTWVSNLPGWYSNFLVFNSEFDSALRFADKFMEDPVEQQLRPPGWFFFGIYEINDQQEGQMDPGGIYYAAVNPKVPTGGHSLWCLRPNILATGTGSGPINSENDTGMYGDFVVDAIDSDHYVSPFQGAYNEAIAEFQDDARSVIGPAESTLATDSIDVSINELDLGNFDFGQRAEDVAGPPGEDAAERADYFERDTPTAAEETFTKSVESGLRCDETGKVEFQPNSKNITGALDIDAVVTEQTTTLKDPTLVDLVNGPAREDETTRGAWQTDLYSFGGTVRGVLDTNENGTFDRCAVPNGQPQPSADFCPWQAFWDAYNGECANDESVQCGDFMEGQGYNVSHPNGTGLYFVLKVTGPTLVIDEDPLAVRPTQTQQRTHVLGDDAPLAQNCVVGTSTGFAPHLQNITGADSVKNITKEVCGGADGETVVITDAFDDQSGDTPGSFSAAIEWAKLPTTSAGAQNLAFGADDGLNVTGVWTVNGTAGDMSGLGPNGQFGNGTHTLTDVDAFVSEG